MFTPEQRLELVETNLAAFPHVKATVFDGLLVDFAVEQKADAIIRGKLNSYDEVTVNIDPNTQNGRINTQQKRVQITFDAEIYDVKEDKVIWNGSAISAVGSSSHLPWRAAIQWCWADS